MLFFLTSLKKNCKQVVLVNSLRKDEKDHLALVGVIFLVLPMVVNMIIVSMLLFSTRRQKVFF